MKTGDIVMGGLAVAVAAVGGYILVEWAIQRYLSLGGGPPKVKEGRIDVPGLGRGLQIPSDEGKARQQAAALAEGSEHGPQGRYSWQLFPGNHPACRFELREEDSFDENWERFQEWMEETWGHAGEPPDEWWEEAYEKLDEMLKKARRFRQEIEIAKFKRSLEEL